MGVQITMETGLVKEEKQRLSPAWILVGLLVLTNGGSIGAAIYFGLRYQSEACPTSTPLQQAVFSATHSSQEPTGRRLAADVTRTYIANLSSSRMVRHELSYAGTPSSKTIVAAGVTSIYDASAKLTHEIHTEVINGSTFGEFTTPSGRVGPHALQVRIVDTATKAESILIPMSLSLRRTGPTLVPNFFFFSHRSEPQSSHIISTFVSTIMGRVVFNDEHRGKTRAAWDSSITPALLAYADAWVSKNSPGRRLDFWDGLGAYAAGKVAGSLMGYATGGDPYAGSEAYSATKSIASGDSAGQTAQNIGWGLASTAASKLTGSSWAGSAVFAADDVAHGEGFGDAVGSVAGTTLGGEAGQAIGTEVGGDAGAALGMAIGGPIGGVVGEEVGAWAGGIAGHFAGAKLGGEIGGDFGTDVDNWASDAWHAL
eukprot:CAMPEP_0174725750 /NCGR_PEP_ID=MMETSP1094-20130205/46332_1 /TAXON_ID=156173 /ORGANISM="Chrysochromulina brevifilum, Strain UTEX LB 985" /LENGTH=426 /DNA_ID=CAMNT_0015927221 /DNA_START=23 /DNA_END=1303 /DNA_ORIENTATION=-